MLIGKKTEAHYISEAIHSLSNEAAQDIGRSEELVIKDMVTEADSVSDEILRTAKAEACNMIVMGHRKKKHLTDRIGEGTLKKILRKGSLPILVVPPEG